MDCDGRSRTRFLTVSWLTAVSESDSIWKGGSRQPAGSTDGHRRRTHRRCPGARRPAASEVAAAAERLAVDGRRPLPATAPHRVRPPSVDRRYTVLGCSAPTATPKDCPTERRRRRRGSDRLDVVISDSRRRGLLLLFQILLPRQPFLLTQSGVVLLAKFFRV